MNRQDVFAVIDMLETFAKKGVEVLAWMATGIIDMIAAACRGAYDLGAWLGRKLFAKKAEEQAAQEVYEQMKDAIYSERDEIEEQFEALEQEEETECELACVLACELACQLACVIDVPNTETHDVWAQELEVIDELKQDVHATITQIAEHTTQLCLPVAAEEAEETRITTNSKGTLLFDGVPVEYKKPRATKRCKKGYRNINGTCTLVAYLEYNEELTNAGCKG